MYKKLVTCLESVRKKIDFKPEVALILGSGLGDFADGIKIEQTIDYTEIEGFPVSTVKGHKGRFVFGYVEDTPIVIMQGVDADMHKLSACRIRPQHQIIILRPVKSAAQL